MLDRQIQMHRAQTTRMGMDRNGIGYARPLSNDDLVRAAPAIFAEQAHASRSDRYAYVSTLDLAEGANRVYQDPPLVDPNAATAVDGVETTVTISFMGSTKPTAGTTATLTTTAASGTFRCTQSEIEYAVGDMVKGTATFVSAVSGS
jgi:hypothetical protein